MPRTAREKSSTGIYHIILRGINRQVIFEEPQDHQKYLETLKKCQEESGYKVYAYCLMSNHIHLLIQEGAEDLGIAFRRIGASFVYWYNRKYSRCGHLFQDRYRSQAVETDGYFLTALRYIHQNPLQAGMVSSVADYRWSSYMEYMGQAGICDVDFALDMFASDRIEAIKLFREFNVTPIQDRCLDFNQDAILNDVQAGAFISSVSGVQNPSEIALFEKGKCSEIIKACKAKGLSCRQIQRLTGIRAHGAHGDGSSAQRQF